MCVGENDSFRRVIGMENDAQKKSGKKRQKNVLELKFDVNSNPDLTFLSDLDLKLERNSKYVNGLNLTDNINLNFN